MPDKPARKHPTGWKKKKLKHPSQLKVSRSIAMKLEHWKQFDALRGDKARGVFLAENITKQTP